MRNKFIPHGDAKPLYPDGTSEDKIEEAVDVRLLDDSLSMAKRLLKSNVTKTEAINFAKAVAASKISPTSLTKEIFGS